MATFDQLPAEQRAIIELVVARGRSYDALADVLQVPAKRVRELAREALVELSPVSGRRVDPQWRGEVADYLLGQQSGAESTATQKHLERSEAARTWALSLLDALDMLYANGDIPAIPEAAAGAVEAEEPPRERELEAEEPPREREEDAAAGREDAEAREREEADAREREREDAEAREREEAGARERDADARDREDGDREEREDAETRERKDREKREARDREPRERERAGRGTRERERPRADRDRDKDRDKKRARSERDRDQERDGDAAPVAGRSALSPAARSALLRRRILGGVAALVLVAAIVVGVLALTGAFSSDDDGTSTASSTETTATATPTTATTPSANPQERPQVLGQVALAPQGGVKAQGVAYILQQGGQRVLAVTAKLPPLPANQRKAAYNVWLYNSPKDAASIGAQFTTAQGDYQGVGPLPANYKRFKYIDVSAQPFNNKTGHSGNSFLRGALADLKPVPKSQQPNGTAPTQPTP